MSMPIVVTVVVDFLDMAVLLQLPPRPSITLGEGQKHGQTIPLADFSCG